MNTQEKESFDQIQNLIHDVSKAKGWHDKPRSALEIAALVHSEISEAVEEARKGTPAIYAFDKVTGEMITDVDRIVLEKLKPEGELVEHADAVIRIFDYFGSRGVSLADVMALKMAYNGTREYRHGGKLF